MYYLDLYIYIFINIYLLTYNKIYIIFILINFNNLFPFLNYML